MKKIMMTAIMCVALMASTSVMAQDAAKKCDSTKTECKKDGEKKGCCKDKKAKSECKKDGEKKACCKDKK